MGSSPIADKVNLSLPTKGYMYLHASDHDHVSFSHGHDARSISVFNDGHKPQGTVTPSFVNHFSDILGQLCHIDG